MDPNIWIFSSKLFGQVIKSKHIAIWRKIPTFRIWQFFSWNYIGYLKIKTNIGIFKLWRFFRIFALFASPTFWVNCFDGLINSQNRDFYRVVERGWKWVYYPKISRIISSKEGRNFSRYIFFHELKQACCLVNVEDFEGIFH